MSVSFSSAAMCSARILNSNMARTTVELSEETKNRLQEARLPHETNYDQTINRLLGEPNAPFVTEEEARSIARAEAKDMIRQYGGR